MEHELDREIRLNENFEYTNYSSWSLQEFNQDGQQCGEDLMPWKWDVFFSASELRLGYTMTIERKELAEDGLEHEPTRESEIIHGVLRPGRFTNDESFEQITSYSMFGADRNRKVEKFDVEIRLLDESYDQEVCFLFGTPSYSYRAEFWDTKEEIVDDQVLISIRLAPERFNKLVEAIRERRADIVTIRLGKVSGFYADWSPSIFTDHIKVLTDMNDQVVVLPDNCKIEPPRLGEVGEFELYIAQIHRTRLRG